MRLNFFFGRLQKKIMTSSSGWDSPKDPVKKVAAKYPKKKFAIVDAIVDTRNVRSLMFEEHEGLYRSVPWRPKRRKPGPLASLEAWISH